MSKLYHGCNNAPLAEYQWGYIPFLRVKIIFVVNVNGSECPWQYAHRCQTALKLEQNLVCFVCKEEEDYVHRC